MRGFWCGTEGVVLNWGVFDVELRVFWGWKGVVQKWNRCVELRGSVWNWGVLVILTLTTSSPNSFKSVDPHSHGATKSHVSMPFVMGSQVLWPVFFVTPTKVQLCITFIAPIIGAAPTMDYKYDNINIFQNINIRGHFIINDLYAHNDGRHRKFSNSKCELPHF